MISRLRKELLNQWRGNTSIRRITQRAHLDQNRPENIHLFTYPRGGSTLLAEAICSVHGCPMVWEPFFKGRKPFANYSHKKLWGWKEYVPIDASHSSIDEYFRAITSRRFLHARFFTGQSIKGLHHKKTLVYKYCHANFLAPYLIRRFDLKCVILDRHPAQIIASRKLYGGFIKSSSIYSVDSAQSKNSKEIFRLYESQRPHYIKTSVGVNAWNYCLSREYFQMVEEKQNVLRLDYDELVMHPEMAAEKLSTFFDRTFSPELFTRPSRVTISPLKTGKDQLNKWKEVLSEPEILEIKSIVHDVFKFHEIDFN